jgi:glycosidase
MPPNNWESCFSGSAWTYDEATGEYYLHLFAAQQPDLNWENPAVVEAVHELMHFWLDKGVDGFRMDVINFISKTPGLPDAEVVRPGFLQSGLRHFACGPRLHEFLQGIGAILREYDAFSVGEMPGVTDTKEILKAVGQDRGELAMAFQFDIVGMDIAPGSASKWYHRDFDPRVLKRVVAKWQSFMLHNAGWNAVFMENHDQGRSVSRYGDDSDELGHRAKSAKLLAAHMALQSGTIFVYQGQELAQINVPESWGLEQYKDIELLNHWRTVLDEYPHDLEKQAAFRRQYRLIGRDNARTPMQWTADPDTYAGFLADDAPKHARPWMSIHPDFPTWNAQAQLADPESPFHYWRRVLRLRKQHKDVFVYGDFEMLDMDHPCIVAYLRTADGNGADEQTRRSSCLVLTNFSRESVWWTVPSRAADVLIEHSGSQGREGGLRTGAVIEELRNYNVHGVGENQVRKQLNGDWAVELRPWEVIVAMDGGALTR